MNTPEQKAVNYVLSVDGSESFTESHLHDAFLQGYKEAKNHYLLYIKAKAFVGERWFKENTIDQVKELLYSTFGNYNEFNIRSPFGDTNTKITPVSELQNFLNETL